MDSKKIDRRAIFEELFYLSANLDACYLYCDEQEIQKYINEAKIEFVYYKPLFDSNEVYKFLEYQSEAEK